MISKSTIRAQQFQHGGCSRCAGVGAEGIVFPQQMKGKQGQWKEQEVGAEASLGVEVIL